MAKVTHYSGLSLDFANLALRSQPQSILGPTAILLSVNSPLEGFDGYGRIVLEGSFQFSGGSLVGGTVRQMTFLAGDESAMNVSLKIDELSIDLGVLFEALSQSDPEQRYNSVLALVYGGSDAVSAGSNDDLIIVAGGDDTVSSGTGDDSIDGGVGDDRISGDAGDDLVDAGRDDDRVDGGIGDDTIIGGSGRDTVFGGDGADGIDGGSDADSLDGGAGADLIIAGSGADTVFGGEGADLIDGGGDADLIDGGAGNDVIRTGAGSDTVDGGDETIGAVGDIVSYEQETARVSVDLDKGRAIEADGSRDKLTDIEGVIGGAGDDLLRGDGSDNLFVTGAGSDLVDGREGFDVVDYSYGAVEGGVVVDLGRGRATEAAGGRDRLSNVEGVFGSFGDDRILGDDGDNILGGVAGADVLTGRGGADDFVFSFGLETGVGLDLIKDFASGEDTLVFDKSAYGLGDRINVFVGSEPVARGRADVFLLDVDTGVLSLDLDGAGAGGAVEIATLKGVTSLTAEDFALI